MGWFHSLLLVGTKPQNPLEESLLAFLKGKRSIDSFLGDLYHSNVCILLRNDSAEVISGGALRPLVIDGAGGLPAVCVFTSGDRARPMAKRLPEYGTMLETAFRSVIVSTPGLGVLINPGSFFSMEGTVDGMDALRHRATESE